MANPQQENGFVGIAYKLYEQLYARNFSVKQLRILMLLLRMSYGCGSKAAFITPQNGFELGCIYKSDIKKELEILEAANVIFCDYKNRLFAINKNYDEWAISFHKLYSSERNQDLIHKNVVSKDAKKSLVENLFVSAELTKKLVHNELSQPEKVSQQLTTVSAELTQKNKSLSTTNNEVSPQLTKKLVHNELSQPENADSESVTGIPIDSIIDNNNTYICICNKETSSNSLTPNSPERKREEPYTGKIQQLFMAEYKKVFKKDCFLNNPQRLALTEIDFENPNFRENLPLLISKFSKIKFNFDGKKQGVGLRWLLEQGNWSGVLSGDFDYAIEEKAAEEETEKTYSREEGWDL